MPHSYKFVDASNNDVALGVVEKEAEQFFVDQKIGWNPKACSVSDFLFLLGLNAQGIYEREHRIATPADLLQKPNDESGGFSRRRRSRCWMMDPK